MTITEMRSRLVEIADELDALADSETPDTDEARAEADEKHTALISEAESIKTQLERAKKVEEVRRLATDESNVERGSEAPNVNVRTDDPYDLSTMRTTMFDGPEKAGKELRSRALQAIEGADMEDEFKDNASKLLRRKDDSEGTISKIILATGSEAYRSAWAKLVTTQHPILTPEENQAVARAMSLTDNAGGYGVPFMVDPTIVLTSNGSTNPFRQISRVETITGDSWNGISTAGITASWDAEATEVSDDAPTLAQPTVPVHKAAAFVPASIEVAQDFRNIEGTLAELFRDAKDQLEATAFAVGSGSGQPTGIVTALTGTASEINASSAETFVAADLYAVEAALGDRYRDNASWVGNKAIFNLARQFDTGGGANLWERLGAGLPAQLIGYPLYPVSAMDAAFDAAATANNYILVLGDFRNYLIADRVGLSIEYIPHLFGDNNRPTGQRGWYAYWRVGADSVNDNAFTMLDVPTTA